MSKHDYERVPYLVAFQNDSGVRDVYGGLAEIVGEGRHGLLFANGDGPALTACLMRIATGADFPEHRLMAGDPEEMAQRFEPGNTLTRWREILAAAAGMGSSTGGGNRSQR